jgi:hypothetical protein
MRAHHRPKVILRRGDRLKRLLAKAHADNRVHLRRVNLSIADIAGGPLGAGSEVPGTLAAEGRECGDGRLRGGGAD